MQIKLEEVIKAIDETDVNTQYYYYIPEERIIIRDDDSIKDKEVIALPSHKQIDDYGTMCNFIEEKTDGEAHDWLEECIRGAGAFRRFRSTLDRFGLTDQWYEYLEEAHEAIAIDWCEYYGIEYLDDEPFQKYETSQPSTQPTITNKHNYRFITINSDNVYGLVYLVIDFRKVLASFRNEKCEVDVDDALDELNYYLSKNYPIYAISDNGKNIGYMVCRIDDDVVWLESIYVRPEYRRKGVGKMLFEKAEAIAKEYGNDTLYNYVHPNNDRMLNFLKDNGYDVLNLIEIRKAYKNEENQTEYSIGDHKYRY
ncbi:MAG: GNAT family N-acetyltransferase [Erysipelotrichaceae bacterium]|nr:GNAT family N-acetyltransferase [Erysipelotrichaceae bacterium]